MITSFPPALPDDPHDGPAFWNETSDPRSHTDSLALTPRHGPLGCRRGRPLRVVVGKCVTAGRRALWPLAAVLAPTRQPARPTRLPRHPRDPCSPSLAGLARPPMRESRLSLGSRRATRQVLVEDEQEAVDVRGEMASSLLIGPSGHARARACAQRCSVQIWTAERCGYRVLLNSVGGRCTRASHPGPYLDSSIAYASERSTGCFAAD